jgi:hypothetical protein
LRGKAVRPDLRDQKRKLFAREMVARLKASRILFYQRFTDYPLMMESSRQMPSK